MHPASNETSNSITPANNNTKHLKNISKNSQKKKTQDQLPGEQGQERAKGKNVISGVMCLKKEHGYCRQRASMGSPAFST